jgi:hypothetical protein
MSKTTVTAADRRTVKFIAIRQANATMNHTMAQPWDRCRPT